MYGKETKQLMARVEEVSGFRVHVDTADDLSNDAQMISADASHPVHMINVSKKALNHADYIVASQCVMLLIMWSHPLGIPKFAVVDEKFAYAVSKATRARYLSKLPPTQAEEAATMLVRGLLHQLRSVPFEILAMQHCYSECPSLRDMQKDYVKMSLQRNSRTLTSSIKEMSPADIYEKSLSLNACFALAWSEIVGSDIAMLPYKSVGFDKRADDLLSVLKAQQGTMGERSVSTVDEWASMMKLRTLYDWNYRPTSS